MLQIPADAPAWVHIAYWAGFVVLGLVFTLVVPRLRTILPAAQPARPTQPMIEAGAAIYAGYDALKVREAVEDAAKNLERIADASEDIAKGVQSLARSEEAGTARALGAMAEQLARLDRRVEER